MSELHLLQKTRVWIAIELAWNSQCGFLLTSRSSGIMFGEWSKSGPRKTRFWSYSFTWVKVNVEHFANQLRERVKVSFRINAIIWLEHSADGSLVLDGRFVKSLKVVNLSAEY